MTNDQIKEIALANGFKLKEQPNGEMALRNIDCSEEFSQCKIIKESDA